VQVGCGVGNTALPLLDLNPRCRVLACDFAPSAVRILLAHPACQPSAGGAPPRLDAFVADVAAAPLVTRVPACSVDVATLVFVLSAMTPHAMAAVRRQRSTHATQCVQLGLRAMPPTEHRL
jgi:methyltransferase-like protein 6